LEQVGPVVQLLQVTALTAVLVWPTRSKLTAVVAVHIPRTTRQTNRVTLAGPVVVVAIVRADHHLPEAPLPVNKVTQVGQSRPARAAVVVLVALAPLVVWLGRVSVFQ
jgi:hypothetical protein